MANTSIREQFYKLKKDKNIQVNNNYDLYSGYCFSDDLYNLMTMDENITTQLIYKAIDFKYKPLLYSIRNKKFLEGLYNNFVEKNCYINNKYVIGCVFKNYPYSEKLLNKLLDIGYEITYDNIKTIIKYTEYDSMVKFINKYCDIFMQYNISFYKIVNWILNSYFYNGGSNVSSKIKRGPHVLFATYAMLRKDKYIFPTIENKIKYFIDELKYEVDKYNKKLIDLVNILKINSKYHSIKIEDIYMYNLYQIYYKYKYYNSIFNISNLIYDNNFNDINNILSFTKHYLKNCNNVTISFVNNFIDNYRSSSKKNKSFINSCNLCESKEYFGIHNNISHFKKKHAFFCGLYTIQKLCNWGYEHKKFKILEKILQEYYIYTQSICYIKNNIHILTCNEAYNILQKNPNLDIKEINKYYNKKLDIVILPDNIIEQLGINFKYININILK